MLTKEGFVSTVAEKAGISKKEANIIVNAFMSVVKETVEKGEEIRIPGFGAFIVRQRGERKAKNFASGEMVIIPAKKVVVFKPGKELKEAVV